MRHPATKILLAGFFSQLLCLGIARFAYTPLLSQMQLEGLPATTGAYLAAINYLGYLAGALVAVRLSDWRVKFYAYRTGLLLAVLTTVGMQLSNDSWWWACWRFLAGLSSAASMLLASGLILRQLALLNRPPELGIHFAGLGLGIALVAGLAECFSQAGLSAAQQWGWLSLLACLLLLPAWRWLPGPRPLPALAGTAQEDTQLSAQFRFLLYLAYFCAGFGYVVTVTFIVAMAKLTPSLAEAGNLAFLVLGLSAAVATVCWDQLARRVGYLESFRIALVVNALAILLPVLHGDVWSLLLSASLFGFSFVGCVSLVLTMAGRLRPGKPAQLMGKLTLCYGSAQVLAPVFSGLLLQQSGQYHQALWMAGAVVLAGVITVSALIRLTSADHLARRRP